MYESYQLAGMPKPSGTSTFGSPGPDTFSLPLFISFKSSATFADLLPTARASLNDVVESGFGVFSDRFECSFCSWVGRDSSKYASTSACVASRT
jgi:hypothetical protein